MSRIETCLTALQELLRQSARSGRIDTERCLRLAAEAERLLPQTIAQAERILAERDRILADAETRARAILADADARAARMTSESVILARADEAARRRESEAAACGALLAQNRALADDVLDSLARFLDALTERTRAYRSALVSRPRGRRP